MATLLNVTLPVFLVLGFGYLTVWRGVFSEEGIDALMKYSQSVAIPFLLFRAISNLDLGVNFDVPLLLTYYSSATVTFIVGIFGTRLLFRRPWEDSVAIGFACLFGNSLLLGLPITQRAYGTDALVGNYVIVSVHAPFCYVVGLITMEIVRSRGRGAARAVTTALKAISQNMMVLALVAGFVVNLSGLTIPGPVAEALDFMARSAIPVALFGLGGVLVRYRIDGDLKIVAFVCVMALVFLPTLVWLVGDTIANLNQAERRSAIITAAMAPGVNAYLFANMYGVAKRVAASSVLIGTTVSIATTSVWLAVVG